MTGTVGEADRAAMVMAVAERRLKQREAADRLGLSVRQVKRLTRRYRERGAAGMASAQRGARSARNVRGRTRLLDVASFSYHRRRKLIRAIEAATERKLLCYVSGVVNGDATSYESLTQASRWFSIWWPIACALTP